MCRELKGAQLFEAFPSAVILPSSSEGIHVLLPTKEMLVMFPLTPADALYWDFVDVVGNQTVPKALALGSHGLQSLAWMQ